MRNFILNVTAEEVVFLANNLPAGARWPEPYDTAALSQIPGGEPAGGLAFRLKVIALRSFMARTYTDNTPPTATLPLELTEAELWFLDYMLNQLDYNKNIMAAGTPIFKFVKKLWDVLLTANAEELDPAYLPMVAAQKIELAPEVQEQQRKMLAELDQLIEGAERTADGTQYE